MAGSNQQGQGQQSYLQNNIRYNRSTRQISFGTGSSENNVPLRDFMEHLRSQGLDPTDVTNIFGAQSGSSRSGSTTERKGETGGTNE